MDCRGFRKYAGAFADGELDVQLNVEALEHLNMCPSCTARVADVEALRFAIQQTHGRISAPPALYDRVTVALDAETGISRSAPSRVASPPSALGRLAVPLGLAAAIALCGTLWWSTQRPVPQPGTLTVVSGRVVSDVLDQHRRCLRHGESHQGAGLPADRLAAAEFLSDELDLAVLVPDLSAQGFDLAGVDRCGIRGRPGAHALYRSNEEGHALSIFTVHPLPALRAGVVEHGVDRDYFVATKESIRVVAWHDGEQTYVACADLPRRELIGLVDHARMARFVPGTAMRLALASTR